MGKLIDEEELKKYIIHDGCDEGCGYIDERDLKYIPTTEAIPKADYEANMVVMLTELKAEIDEMQCLYHYVNEYDVNNLIQQKINALNRGNK